MATSTPNKMRRLKGRLVWNPTGGTVTGAYPYGGTQLGFCRSATFVWGIQYQPIRAEEFGGVIVDYVYQSETAVFSAVLRDYDDDMVQTIFPNFSKGFNGVDKQTTSGQPIITGTVKGTTKPGSLIGEKPDGAAWDSRSGKLLFAPDDEDNHEFLVIYRAVPMLDQSADLRLTAAEWAETGVVFHATPVSAGNLYQFGRKTDISL